MARFRNARSCEEEETFLERATPASTRYATRWAVKLFDEWVTAREIKEVKTDEVDLENDVHPIQPLTTLMEDMNATSLAFWLSKFVGEVASLHGKRYPARTLYCLVCGLNRHLLDVKGVETVNIIDKNDRRFSGFQKVLDAEMKDATACGIGVASKKKERSEITEEEEIVLWQKKLLGGHTAESLMHTLYFYNGKLFGIRAGEHRLLRLKNFTLSENCIVFKESMSKTFHGGLNDLKYTPRNVEHVCHKLGEQHVYCLVSLYKLYLSLVEKLAEGKEAFYFRPYRDKSVFRYENSVVGMNTLNSILPDKLCRIGGLERKTAHSLRVTCATRLYQSSIDEKQTRERTGHKSNALQRYERPSKEQMLKVSECLGVPNNVNLLEGIFDADSSVKRSECDFGGFECDVSDEVLGSIDESVFVKEECAVSDGNVNCVVKPVFNNCCITFNYAK